MNNKQAQQIEEVLSLLSKERVNTAGLGAPINILKELLEDNKKLESGFCIGNTKPNLTIMGIANKMFEQLTEPSDKIPSAEEYVVSELRLYLPNPTLNTNVLSQVVEDYALLREQRAVEHEQDLCNQRLDELSAHYEAKILEAVEVERKKWDAPTYSELFEQINKIRLENPLKPFLNNGK